MNFITAEINLAKKIFAVHGVNDNDKPLLVKPEVSRADLLPLIGQLPTCLNGMNACIGARHQERLFRKRGQSGH